LGAKIRWELESCFNLAGAKDVGNSQGFMLSHLSGAESKRLASPSLAT
jgi:hypothetical protein